MGDRRGAKCRCGRCGRRQVAHEHDDHAGRLCLHLRSERPDGRAWPARREDYEDLEVTRGALRAPPTQKGVNLMLKIRLLLAAAVLFVLSAAALRAASPPTGQAAANLD